MKLETPRVAIAGLAGDSGKTLVTLGLARACVERGLAVAGYKKGPDYIDAAWLAAATGCPCRNLDTFFMNETSIGRSVAAGAAADLLLIEGNRGLYDGVDAGGSHSTAELAKKLGSPVVLVVNVTKQTRTAAAVVLGCREMDPDLDLAGVILNRVGTARQERVLREAIETATGIPVVGAIPRLGAADFLPSRHLGLMTVAEHPQRDKAIALSADIVSKHVDLGHILEISRRARAVEIPFVEAPKLDFPVTIGFFSDPAFSFYYPENLEMLTQAGARLVPISPATDSDLPDVDAVYIGGGFPEVHATRLAENGQFAERLRSQVEAGLPVYAECGGLMYLGRELLVDGVTYQMAGVLDLVIEQTSRPQGHGYEVARVVGENPYFEQGVVLTGHEFHYSKIVGGADRDLAVLELERGTGCGEGRDGLVKGRVWASYLHLHALGTPEWAEGLLNMSVHAAAERAASRAAWA